MKQHFKSDGNGGFVISKEFLGFILLIIAILTPLISVVVSATTTNNEVKRTVEEIATLKHETKVISEKVIKTERDYEFMKESLSDIKSDLKDIKNSLMIKT